MANQITKTPFELVVFKVGGKVLQISNEIDTIVLASSGKQEVWTITIDENGLLELDPRIGSKH